MVARTTDEILSAYYALHDRVSDMIEDGRLTAEHIPDDYQWLVDRLAELAVMERDKTDAERFVDSVASTPLDGDEIGGVEFDYGGNDPEHEVFAEIVHEARARTTARPAGYEGE